MTTMEAPEKCVKSVKSETPQWRPFGFFIINSEQISHIILVWCIHCEL